MAARRSFAGFMLAAVVLGSASATAEQVKLTFLHVNDIYEYSPVQGKGGLAELLTLVEAERARAPQAVFTFGGDLFSPSLLSSLTGGGHMVALLNDMGVDVATLGNHEFDLGAANAATQMGLARFPWVVANVKDGDGTPFGGAVPTTLLRRDGVTIGVVGVLTAKTGQLSSAAGVRFEPELPALRQAVDALRAQGAEVVVALTHLDFDLDRQLAREITGVDLVLGGHDHDPASIQEGGALVVKAGADAHYLSVVELVVDRPGVAGKSRVYPAAWRFLSTQGVPPHPKLEPQIAQYDGMLDGAMGQEVATTQTALDSRAATVRGGEAAIGNLVADSLRARLKTDVALVNGGGIRGNRQYPAGTVLTKRDLRSELPFNNVIVALSVTGAQLKVALENGVSQIEAKAGRFPHSSGMDIVYDPAQPVGSRVVSVTIAGRPMEDGGRYSLATIEYLAKGGDGYGVLKDARVLVDSAQGPMLAAVVIEHAAAAATIAPTIEGRIRPVR